MSRGRWLNPRPVFRGEAKGTHIPVLPGFFSSQPHPDATLEAVATGQQRNVGKDFTFGFPGLYE